MKLSPFAAASIEAICRLNRDNFDSGNFWILTDGDEVSIVEQKLGETPSQRIAVPRATFNRLIGWYMRGQKVKR